MFRAKILPLLASMLALGACAQVPPPGPNVLVVPAQNKPLPQFQQEDAKCRGYAQQQLGANPHQGDLQQRYDIAYAQCMVASGNQVQLPPMVWPDGAYGSYGYGYPYSAYPYGTYSDLWFGPAVGFGFVGG